MTSNNHVRWVKNVRIKGLACSLPEKVEEVACLGEVFGTDSVAKIIGSTGVERRHVVTDECSSDLCFAAAEQLIADLGIDRSGGCRS